MLDLVKYDKNNRNNIVIWFDDAKFQTLSEDHNGSVTITYTINCRRIRLTRIYYIGISLDQI